MLETVLCSCGSGLRRIRCCGLDLAALPAPPSLELLDPMVAEATKLFNTKKHREAETLVLKLLDLAPNHRLAIRVLFELRKAENRHPATEILARRLAELPAGNAAQATAANLALAQLLVGQGRHAEAVVPARNAVKRSPRDIAAHHIMGMVFTEIGELRPGEQHYRKAMALQEREDGVLFGNLAWNLKLQGRLEEAAACYQRAVAIRPDNRRAIGGYAQTQAARGDKAHAASLLDAAQAQGTTDRSLRLLRAMLDLLTDPGAALARLDDSAGSLLPAELMARGRASLLLGQTTEAIAGFATARQMQRERFGQVYEPAPFIQKSAQYQAFFTSDGLSALPRPAPVAAVQPIFLIGFPGSGTSLLEQLLANIPGFAAGDEFSPVSDLLKLPELENYPECLVDFLIGDGQIRLLQLRARFLQNLAASGLVSNEHRFITLRAAGDAWHLGLIKSLFPEAPIIHLLRHPLDIAVTNFGRDKKLEANCTASLTALAQQYGLVMSMIRHYRGQLALRYLPVRYEALVADPASVLRDLLEFIGARASIPGDDRLRANLVAQASRVPGHVVSQQPIHRRGINIHSAFEAAAPNLLAEIRPILTPWIEELGYAP